MSRELGTSGAKELDGRIEIGWIRKAFGPEIRSCGPRRAGLLVLGVAALLLVQGQASAAAPLSVCASGCPYTTIADALAAANGGDKIMIGAGSYSGGFTIVEDVTLLGAGAGETTISGGGPAVTVVSGATAEIDGVTISGATTYFTNGGGIANLGTLTVKGSTISGNYGSQGGGIYNSGTLTVKETTLAGNQAGNGAGIYNAGVLTVKNTTLAGNFVGARGGGIYNSGTATINNSMISNNSHGCACSGAGVMNDGGTLTVMNSTIRENGGGSLNGGGIFNGVRFDSTLGWVAGAATLIDSVVSGNNAYYQGGGITNLFSTLTLIDSIVSGNSTSSGVGSGGGIYNVPGSFLGLSGTVTLRDSTVSGNTPDDCVGC